MSGDVVAPWAALLCTFFGTGFATGIVLSIIKRGN